MSKPVPYETTLHVRDACLCLHAQRAARTLARHFDEAFRPLGITNGQFSLMMALNRPEPPGVAAVADVLAMDRTTLTAALKPLERRGLVSVSTSETDRRARRLALTDDGERLLASAATIWRERHAALAAAAGDGLAGRLADVVAAVSALRSGPDAGDGV